MMGFQIRDKQKTGYSKKTMLRLGISYFSGTTMSCYINGQTKKRYDTVTSNTTGQTVYLDSTINKNYEMNYSSQQLRLDGSFIYRTNPDERWYLFGGVGFNAGFSIKANTEIRYNSYLDNNYSSNYFSTSITEKYKNKNMFVGSVYVPIGLDFRLGVKREFWKRTHLFYEFRPSVNFTTIPEIKTMANTGLQHGIGLRINW